MLFSKGSITIFFLTYFKEIIEAHKGISGQTPFQAIKGSSLICNLRLIKYVKIKHVHDLFTEFKVAA